MSIFEEVEAFRLPSHFVNASLPQGMPEMESAIYNYR